MANRHEENLIQFEVKVPNTPKIMRVLSEKGYKFKIKLHPDDFKLSWMEMFKIKQNSLWKKLQPTKDRFTIKDRRSSSERKIWSLTATIDKYVDSFHKALGQYTATISTSAPNTIAATPVPSGTPQPSTSRAAVENNRSQNGKRVSFPNPPNTNIPNNVNPRDERSAARTNGSPVATLKRGHPGSESQSNVGKKLRVEGVSSGGPPNQNRNASTFLGRPQNSRPVFLNLDADDSASMADSMVSQDSQVDDLMKLGVENEQIKDVVCARFSRQVDNSMMLLIRHELQQLMDSGRYLRSTRHLPHTVAMLSLVFNLQSR